MRTVSPEKYSRATPPWIVRGCSQRMSPSPAPWIDRLRNGTSAHIHVIVLEDIPGR